MTHREPWRVSTKNGLDSTSEVADKRNKQGPTPMAARTVSSYGCCVNPCAAAGRRAAVLMTVIFKTNGYTKTDLLAGRTRNRSLAPDNDYSNASGYSHTRLDESDFREVDSSK